MLYSTFSINTMLRRCFISNLRSRTVQRIHTISNLSSKFTNVKESDGVREITLNDPKTRNSLSMAMMEAIYTDINKDIHNENLRCIVLAATGPVFSAGHNLKELASNSGSDLHRNVFRTCSDLIMSIHKAPVPVIAKIDGLAAAAGCQLVASCDIAVCSDKSSFSTPGANYGIFCTNPGVAIGRVMPRMKSAYMVMTGLTISAEDAFSAGLVSSMVQSDQLDAEIEKICNAIRHKSRAVIKLGKEYYYQQLEMNLSDAYTKGVEVMTKNLLHEDGKEGIQSFVEKRKPKWSHSN